MTIEDLARITFKISKALMGHPSSFWEVSKEGWVQAMTDAVNGKEFWSHLGDLTIEKLVVDEYRKHLI